MLISDHSQLQLLFSDPSEGPLFFSDPSKGHSLISDTQRHTCCPHTLHKDTLSSRTLHKDNLSPKTLLQPCFSGTIRAQSAPPRHPDPTRTIPILSRLQLPQGRKLKSINIPAVFVPRERDAIMPSCWNCLKLREGGIANKCKWWLGWLFLQTKAVLQKCYD